MKASGYKQLEVLFRITNKLINDIHININHKDTYIIFVLLITHARYYSVLFKFDN